MRQQRSQTARERKIVLYIKTINKNNNKRRQDTDTKEFYVSTQNVGKVVHVILTKKRDRQTERQTDREEEEEEDGNSHLKISRSMDIFTYQHLIGSLLLDLREDITTFCPPW